MYLVMNFSIFFPVVSYLPSKSLSLDIESDMYSYPVISYLEKCAVQIWKRDIASSPYRSFNFQQLFFYDIFLCNAYFTSYRSSKYSL